jgi:hypothetical protein
VASRSPEPIQGHVTLKHFHADPARNSQKAIELWQKGCSLHDIARITGKSRSWIGEILRKHKIGSRPKIDESKITAWRNRPRTQAHPPFGYAYLQGQHVIEAREHEILLDIDRLAKEKMIPNAIAEQLNAKSLKPRRAPKWNRNSVDLILRRNQKSI